MTDDSALQFLEHACRGAGVAFVATDTDLRVRFWNDFAARLFGRSAEDMLGEPIETIVPENRRSLAQRALDRALKRREPSHFEVRFPDATGTERYLAVSVSPVIDSAGACLGASVCASDVSHGMEMVRDVAEAQRMSSLGTMAGAVAHHFNNLLGGITMTIDFALEANDPLTSRRALETTAAGLARAERLMHALLVFAEGDHSESPHEAIVDTVRFFVERHREDWLRRRIEVEAEPETVDVLAPARCIMAILEAVTTNALDAMPDGGKLTIRLTGDNHGGVVLTVRDTGTGIHEANLRHVFEPFFTTHRGDPAAVTGHDGLGLSAVHGLVRDLGGQVTLACLPGGGTECTIRLPGDMCD